MTDIQTETEPLRQSGISAASERARSSDHPDCSSRNHTNMAEGVPSPSFSDCSSQNHTNMTEEELHQYYKFYRDWVQGNLDGGYITGTTLYNEDTWMQLYTSFGKQKYRVLNEQEHYEFLGWKLDGRYVNKITVR